MITDRMVEVYWTHRNKGRSMAMAAKAAGFSQSTAKRVEGKFRTDSNKDRTAARAQRVAVAPVPYDELRGEAKRALSDFTYFQRRYFGRVATRWQAMAAEKVLGWLESTEREMAVINVAPGSGKTTLFTHDIPAWLTARNRAIRGLLGSKTESGAGRYTARLRRTLERTTPIRAEAKDLSLGLALDAEACMCDEYGTFQSPGRLDIWAGSTFIVAQLGGLPIDEKEPTWMPAGYDSAVLGMRYDFIVWDDLVDKKSLRTQEGRDAMREWWDDVAEARLEPSGLLLLQGQRLGPEDLYRYCLNKVTAVFDEDDIDEQPQVYHHIAFKAHDPTKCQGKETHARKAPYWPEGCLLDPRRLGWTHLKTKMGNRQTFEVVYQQEDTDPEDVLVDPLWISGGTDPRTGVEYPGCWDKDRDVGELPRGLAGDLVSYCTVDPSPTKWWAIQWWVARCLDGKPHERYLMDLQRAKMTAPDFLQWSPEYDAYIGLAEEWQERSEEIGLPIRAWIVERNGAQRFLLQYDFVRRWCAEHRTEVWPHDTGINKNDEKLGVPTISTIWQFGLVRLPGKPGSLGGQGWTASMKLVEEVTNWTTEGTTKTDDQVMAQWFGELALPTKLVPRGAKLPRAKRPTWLRNTNTYGWARNWRKSA